TSLIIGFNPIVEFLIHSLGKFVEQRLNLCSGGDRLKKTTEALQLAKIATQRFICSRILDLNGDLSSVMPDSTMYLANTGRCCRFVIEFGKPFEPRAAELFGKHPMGLRSC